MLKDKVALITGSTSGIGLGIAEVLAKAGCNIVINGFGNPKDVDILIQRLQRAYQIKVIYSPANMKKPLEIAEMINFSIKELGCLDILVNNAGIQHVDRIEDFPDEKWEEILSINLSASFYTIKNSINHMQKQGWGRIINIASAHGLVASANKSAYVAAKHGLTGLTKAVALENAENNITCNAICPGWVLTPLVQKQIEDKAKQLNISIKEAENSLLSEKQPSLKFVKPSDIGKMVEFLCSPAAEQITGTTLSIDGGWTAR